MSDFFLKPNPKKDFAKEGSPLDNVEVPDPKSFDFESELHSQWGWYPFIYESETTMRLGGNATKFVSFGGGVTIGDLNLPSVEIVDSGGSDDNKGPGQEGETLEEIISKKLCFTSATDTTEIDPDVAADPASQALCQSLIGPCPFMNYMLKMNEAIVDNFTSGLNPSAGLDDDSLEGNMLQGGGIDLCGFTNWQLTIAFFNVAILCPGCGQSPTCSAPMVTREIQSIQMKATNALGNEVVICTQTDVGGCYGVRSQNTLKEFYKCLKNWFDNNCPECDLAVDPNTGLTTFD